MCVDFCFEKTLEYTSPAHGGWGIVRTTALVPESQILFITPSDCFRHGSLGAVQHGYKEKVAYLGLTPPDVIGGYDELMMEAMSELVEDKERNFKVLFFFAGCIDDFVGTDKEAIAKQMEDKYKDVLFIPAYMNPIDSDSKRPPMVSCVNGMMKVCVEGLKKWRPETQKNNTVNLLGNFALIPKENEIFSFFKSHGYELLQVGEHKTLSSYISMGLSKLNIVTTPIAGLAASTMDKELRIPSVNSFISYDIEEIKKSYEIVEEKLNDDIKYDFTLIEKETRQIIEEAVKAIDNKPILVSGSAVLRPFSLAKALISYGFNVKEISAQVCAGPDREAFEFIKSNCKEITIHQTGHHRAAVTHSEETKDMLSIGYEGAYLGNTSYVVDLVDDEEMYGFYGVQMLMRKMIEACKEKTNLREMIEEYGAVV